MNDRKCEPGRDEYPPYQTDALLNAWMSQTQPQRDQPNIIRIDALGIADPIAGITPDASLIVRSDTQGVFIEYAGAIAGIPEAFSSPQIPLLTLHDQLIMPALVNAHTHLDLTHIGPQPHDPSDGFVPWVDMIRASRVDDDEKIRSCVRLGIEKSLAGGVIAVGDIAGAPSGRLCDAPARELAHSPLNGVSFLEFFGIGSTVQESERRIGDYLRDRAPGLIEQLAPGSVRLGLQPHAPNTVALSLYQWIAQAAGEHGLALCTHLAETIEERMFIADGIGPQRAMLQRFGIWEDSILDSIAKGRHPIEHLRPVLESQPFLVAHVNDCDDAGIETLARTKTSVAYCPRASGYFHAPQRLGPHRYRDLLDAGVNVCLGTDSIVNLDTPDRISTLDDMRLLHAQGEHDQARLLAMSTLNAAVALGIDPGRFRIEKGRSPMGLIALRIERGKHEDLWSAAMTQTNAPDWLFLE